MNGGPDRGLVQLSFNVPGGTD